MNMKEGVKDFIVGLFVIVLGAILTILLIMLWPFIAVIGYFAIILLSIAIAILIAFGLIMLVGKVVRGFK